MALCTQITAIILTPNFPGWLAPMHFNPTRFEEFLSFAITVCGTWVGAAWLVGGYKANATSGDTTACYDTISTASRNLTAAGCPLHTHAALNMPAAQHDLASMTLCSKCHRGTCVAAVSPAPSDHNHLPVAVTHSP